MELNQLEAFIAVAEARSFSAAAKALKCTQPAVSQTVRKLEEELGELLFDRSSRDGTLTQAGTILLDYAHKLLNLRGEARASLVELRQAQRGVLSVAANEFTSLYLVRALDEFRRFFPAIRIAVQRAFASRVQQLIMDHTVELGMLAFRPEDPKLRSVVVYRDELAFVVHPAHPLSRASQVSIRQLGAESFVAHNVASPYRLKVLEAFKRHKTRLNMDVELPTLEAIKKFVALGNGVALLPAISVEAEVGRGELMRIPVRELKIERRLRIVSRKGSSLSHAARALLKTAESLSERRGSSYLFQPES
jgi:DNA-binding transcriptional LysR family regulator